MKRKLAIFTLVLIFTGTKTVYPDTWACPPEKNYYAENKMFAAHVTAAKEDNKPLVEVFKIKGSEKTSLWQSTLGNEYSPGEAFVSDDGKYVVTVNECSRRVHGGFGDHVVAFYNEAGLIKNYSLEQILHYPKDIDEQEFRNLFQRSVSGRSWAYRPMFFDEYDGKMYFCVWLIYGERWLAWQVSNGEEVKINDEMMWKWNHRGRSWALEEIGKGTRISNLYEFLGKQRNPDDRHLFEALLSDENFYLTGGGFSRVFRTSGGTVRPKFVVISSSPKRTLAERVLAAWDGKSRKHPDSHEQMYYYLGKVELAVRLPEMDKAREGNLLIYLIPSTVANDNWYKTVPIHRFAADLTENREQHNDCFYRIEGVTPGKYWIKVIWDKAEPHWNRWERPTKVCLPLQGDYESLESPPITVKAGETVENIVIDCTQKVTNGTD